MRTTFEPQNILIVKHRALGDSILGLSSLSYIRSIFANAKVSYAVTSWTAKLYENCDLACDELVELKLDSLSGTWQFFRHLAARRYDLVIELHQSGRTSKVLNLAKHLFGFRYIYHNHHLKTGHVIRDQGVRKAILQRDLDTCWSAAKLVTQSSPRVPNYLEWAPTLRLKKNIQKKAKLFILGVVASRKDKQWPIDSFINLMEKMSANDPSCSFLVPVSHSPEDQKLADRMTQSSLKSRFEVVQLPLKQLPERLAEGDFYIGNDTGLKHLCIALGLGSLTFFGPEEPVEWHPYDLKKHPYIWSHGQDARTQMSLTCSLVQFDLSKRLDEVDVDEVYEVLRKQVPLSE